MERSEELSNANVAQFALSPRAIIRWVSPPRPDSAHVDSGGPAKMHSRHLHVPAFLHSSNLGDCSR